MYLPDPRLYPRVNAKNPVIRSLMAFLTASEPADAQQKRQALDEVVRELLLTGDHYGLNGALTQAPTQDAYKVLWKTLRDAVEQPAAAGTHAVPFALPIVFVAGRKGDTRLAGEVDAGAILALLREHGVIAADADVWLGNALIGSEQLAAVNPTQLSRWQDGITVAGPLPAELAPAPIAFKDEGVFVRYLVGVAIQPAAAEPVIRLGGAVGSWGMPLAQLLSDAFKQTGLTLFPIPRVPQSWLAAQEAGRVTVLETRLQVAASNALRSIRSKGRTPVITLAAHEGGEIRLTFSSREDAERWEGYVWPLAPLDSAEQVHAFVEDLMRECQVDDVVVVETIQPDLDTDGLPFFVTAHNRPVQQQ
ncbi:hypothetical protein [Jeongeupia chitinilytica]|uniref:Uncharacterized protein n=1 Tax=Jeongeupia chitinilytica TaxID=1041641 RepID=A0ABQ3GY97_9NEIS|nr:hypothetical protein [Jeongeupia chitinilytica]GHD58487.1 hypothetical protein GCM10007350_08430 [Jeongeupia chitinilytica]